MGGLSCIRLVCDGADLSFTDESAPVVGAGQEEDGLLDVRGEMEEVHDLADADAGDVGQPRQVGVVGHHGKTRQAHENAL